MLKLPKAHPLKTRGSQSSQGERTGTDKYRRKIFLGFGRRLVIASCGSIVLYLEKIMKYESVMN